jgi:hypothetical protein
MLETIIIARLPLRLVNSYIGRIAPCRKAMPLILTTDEERDV